MITAQLLYHRLHKGCESWGEGVEAVEEMMHIFLGSAMTCFSSRRGKDHQARLQRWNRSNGCNGDVADMSQSSSFWSPSTLSHPLTSSASSMHMSAWYVSQLP
jgi:hypothetical protein